MYQIKWEKIIPGLLPKFVDRRVVRAYGSHFDCQFSLNFDDESSVQFKCDDIIHRNAIEFEIILNRSKIYNPLHFDSSHVFINNLGKVIEAKEHRTPKRNNVREIYIIFDASKKHFKVSEIILQSAKYQYFIDQTIAEEIAQYLQPRNDTMIIRTFRKNYQKNGPSEQQKIEKITNHQKLVNDLINKKETNNNNNNDDNNNDINSVYSLYPIRPNENNEQTNNHNHSSYEAENKKKSLAKSLYPLIYGNDSNDNDNDDNTNHNEVQTQTNNNNNKNQNLSRKNNKKEYEKIYCDVIFRISTWNTYTTTAKKQAY